MLSFALRDLATYCLSQASGGMRRSHFSLLQCQYLWCLPSPGLTTPPQCSPRHKAKVSQCELMLAKLRYVHGGDIHTKSGAPYFSNRYCGVTNIRSIRSVNVSLMRSISMVTTVWPASLKATVAEPVPEHKSNTNMLTGWHNLAGLSNRTQTIVRL